MTKHNWFDVDRVGLAKLIEDKDKSALVYELIQNAWDASPKGGRVDVILEVVPGRANARLTVKDECPDGFIDLSHAWTLFAESDKKSDPTKRGRFNLGEKLVLAMCEDAMITTTTGTVSFTKQHGRKRTKGKTKSGSIFAATLRMTRAELAAVERSMLKLLPPTPTYFNSRLITRGAGALVNTVTASLPTMISGPDGVLRKCQRRTEVCIHKVRDDEVGTLYEMGIPVIETGDIFHVDVQQKIPLNMDRDNVQPSYLRHVRALTLNVVSAELTPEQASSAWVTDALTHKAATDTAVCDVVDARFGEDAVVYDPSDKEANNRAVGKGITVVHGGSLPKAAWEAVRRAEALKPAGQVFPTPKPYSTDPKDPPVEVIPEDEWTAGMRAVAAFTSEVGRRITYYAIQARMVSAPGGCFIATFHGIGSVGIISYNVATLGTDWFDVDNDEKLTAVVDLFVHELAHFYEGNHLKDSYHEALTDIAARLAVMTMRNPGTLLTLRSAGTRDAIWTASQKPRAIVAHTPEQLKESAAVVWAAEHNVTLRKP
jgi:hypothetical protein